MRPVWFTLLFLNIAKCCLQFLGACIAKLNKFFLWIHIVKGRPRHPQSQGCIERSHATFKAASRAWMKENDNTPNWHLGMHVVQCQVNNHPIKVRDDLTPYIMY